MNFLIFMEKKEQISLIRDFVLFKSFISFSLAEEETLSLDDTLWMNCGINRITNNSVNGDDIFNDNLLCFVHCHLFVVVEPTISDDNNLRYWSVSNFQFYALCISF